MSKTKRIVLISVLSVVLALVILLAVLFGAVFVLRNQSVSFLTELDKAEIYTKYPECESKIINFANFKLNKSIFNQDKERAKQNIENEFTYVKVTNISFLNANTIDIQLRARYEMFYYNVSDKYFVLDEDLKVLNVVNTKEELRDGLIKINPVKFSETTNEPISTNILGADINTTTNNFIGGDYQSIFSNLYKAIYSTVKIEKSGEQTYVDREDIKQLLKEIFKKYLTFTL